MFKNMKEKMKSSGIFETKYLKTGGYSAVATILVICLLVAANVLVRSLPSSWMKLDVTSNQLYSISYNTKKILSSIDKDVTIYLVTQEDEKDETLSILLERYDSLSEHIELVEKDPDIYPNFLDSYGVSTVTNNSVVVECGDRYRYIAYDEIYETTSSGTTGFAGESEVTSAISYVVLEELPVLYSLSGHGEDSLSSDYSEAVEKENIEVKDLSLIEESEIPEDCTILMINNPDSDISEIELDAIEEYLNDGGKMFVVMNLKDADTDFTNIETLMEDYGATLNKGVLIENNSSNYAWNMPYYLLANIDSHEITDPLIEENYYVMLPVAEGLTVNGSYTTTLLETSSESFLKVAGYDITTYSYEEGDIEGPFALAALYEKNDTAVIFVSSSALLDDTINSYVSGGNRNFFLNCLNYLSGNEESISIRVKTTEYNYLTMDSTTTNNLSILFIAVIPLAVLIGGIAIYIARRKK